MAAPRPELRLVLAAALTLGAACKRAPASAPTETPELAPPAPSASLVTTPLDSATTGFTNEMQAKAISKETNEMGIDGIDREYRQGDPAPKAAVPQPPPDPEARQRREYTQAEKIKQAHALQLQYRKMRRDMDAATDRSVAITGSTASMISGRESGGVVGVDQDAPGVWSGAYGGAVDDGDRVVETTAAWNELWGRLSRETPPSIDFEKNRVAAIFAGHRPTPGYRARLVSVAAEPERWLVRWYEEGPAPDEAVGEGETAPFLLVTVPKDEKAVRGEKIRRSIGPKRK